jgi:hypothetical protein
MGRTFRGFSWIPVSSSGGIPGENSRTGGAISLDFSVIAEPWILEREEVSIKGEILLPSTNRFKRM